jgi:hypothetical protein
MRAGGWAALVALLAAGCSTPGLRTGAPGGELSELTCRARMRSLDSAIASDGVHDAGAYPVPGFAESLQLRGLMQVLA